MELSTKIQPSREIIVRAFRRVPHADWVVVAWVLVIKLLLFLFGVKAFQILSDKRVGSTHAWLELWSRWDGLRYLHVAQAGYDARNLHVYPLFPWLIRFVGSVTGDLLVAALLVATLSSIVAPLVFRRLVQLDYPPEIAQRAVWFFLIFPTAYFLHVGYTESIFLALTFGCLLAARTDRWWVAGILGAFATMTRANGLALLPALIVEAIQQGATLKQWRWRWLWIAIVPAGFGVYMLINSHVGGEAFAFFKTRKEVFYTTMTAPWVGLRSLIGNLGRSPSQGEMVGAQELFFVVLGLITALLSWIKLRPAYAMWVTVSWLGVTSQTFVQSAPRYTLAMFPVFILFALAARNRFLDFVITVWSVLFLALFTSLFVRGWWAF